MYDKLFRRFGFTIMGIITVTGGGLLIVYGILLMYVTAPNAHDISDLRVIHETIFWLVQQHLLYVLLVFGLLGFVWEIYTVGFFPRDDRLLYERHRDMRREIAEEKEVWDKPGMDEESDPYEDLYEDLHEEDEKLTLARTRFNTSGSPSVAGLVMNKSGRKGYRDIIVEIEFYDAEKQAIDRTIATKKEINPGDSWEFEVFPAPEHSNDTKYYKVTNIRAEEV
jgi:hypothetical protein